MGEVRDGIGLAMSGGGFRAALFHLGALRRLDELGFLRRISRYSSVSGGSIVNALLALRWDSLTWDEATGVSGNLDSVLVRPIRQFCSRDIDTRAIAVGGLHPWKSIPEALQDLYDELYGGADLQALPDPDRADHPPEFFLNSTNTSTGDDFRFTRSYVADYRIGMIKAPRIKVSLAVAASSAFPPVLSPVVLDTSGMAFHPGPDQRPRFHDDPDYRVKQFLVDGGVYDNLGLEPVDDFRTILVSDAGAPFDGAPPPFFYADSAGMRSLAVSMDQNRRLRKRMLLDKAGLRQQTVGFWGIDTDIAGYGPVPGALPAPHSRIRDLARLRTRLDSFSEAEQERLINWGYAVCDASMRRYIVPDSTSRPAWPHPQRQV